MISHKICSEFWFWYLALKLTSKLESGSSKIVKMTILNFLNTNKLISHKKYPECSEKSFLYIILSWWISQIFVVCDRNLWFHKIKIISISRICNVLNRYLWFHEIFQLQKLIVMLLFIKTSKFTPLCPIQIWFLRERIYKWGWIIEPQWKWPPISMWDMW